MTPLLIAITLLTCLPVSRWLPRQWSESDQGLSPLWYPVVGLLLAALLLMVSTLMPEAISSWLRSGLLLCVWVLLTGALHLDGLVDCIDAIYAGHRIADSDNKRQKIIEVLKEPTVGTMGVVALILVLLIKVIVLAVLTSQLAVSLVVALVMARLMALLLIVTTPYAQSHGLAAVFTERTPRPLATLLIIVISCSLFLLLPVITVLILLTVLTLLWWVWRRFWLSTIGGFTGDGIGALVELSEVFILLILYIRYL